jgi:hypothetical protein
LKLYKKSGFNATASVLLELILFPHAFSHQIPLVVYQLINQFRTDVANPGKTGPNCTNDLATSSNYQLTTWEVH